MKPKPITYRIFAVSSLTLMPGEWTERTAAVVAAANAAKTIGTCGIIRSDGDLGFVGPINHGIDLAATGRIVGSRVEILSVAASRRA